MTQLVGDVAELQDSFVGTWLARAEDKVEDSVPGHVAAMIREARKADVLRPPGDDTSDGFHTFGELYRHRMLLTAALFRAMTVLGGYHPHKSRLHSDGEVPFGGGWFIVVAQLPTGQISYHYPLEHWNLFQIPERGLAAEWDQHTAGDSADRLQRWLEQS